MYQNPKFRQAFQWILGAILIFIVLRYFVNQTIDLQHLTRSLTWGEKLFYNSPFYIFNIAIWLGVGYAYNYQKEAYTTLGVIAGCKILFLIIAPVLKTSLLFIIITSILFDLLPYVLFGWLVFKDQRFWSWILVGLVMKGIYTLGYSNNTPILTDLLTKLFTDYNSPNYVKYLFMVAQSMCIPIGFLVISHAIYSSQNHRNLFAFHTIDLSNTYSKKLATALFLVFSLSLFYLCANVAINIRSQGNILVLPTIYLVSLLYRNFLTEYSITLYGKIGWWIYGLTIPIINLIVWFINLDKTPLTSSYQERSEYFQKNRHNKNNSVATFIFIMVILLFFFSLINASTRGYDSLILRNTLSFFIGIGILALYVFNKVGIWFMMGLVGLALLLLAFYVRSSVGTKITEIYMTGVSNMIILYSLFHMYTYKDISAYPKGLQNREGEEEF